MNHFHTSLCKMPYFAMFVVGIALSVAGDISAQTFTGGGDGFSWNDGSNWDGGIAPGPDSDNFEISIQGQPNVVINEPTVVGGPEAMFGSFSVGNSSLTINQATQFNSGFLTGNSFSLSTININAVTQFNSGFFGFSFSRSTINVGADVDFGFLESPESGVVGAGVGEIRGGTLNLNSGVLRGGLSLSSGGSADSDDPFGGGFPGFPGFPAEPGDQPFVVNRNGGLLELNFLSVSGENNTFAFESGDQVAGVIDVSSGATVTANIDLTLTNGIGVNQGTLNVDASVDAGTGARAGTEIQNGTLNLNSGVLAGDLLIRNTDFAAPASQVIRNGGSLDLISLNIVDDVSLTLQAGDRVSNSIFATDNAVLTIDADQDLAGDSTNVFVTGNATLNLNANLVAGTLDVSGTLNRAEGAAIDVNRLSLTGVQYDLDGTDTVRTFLEARDGSTINVLSPVSGTDVNLFGFNLSVEGNSTINIDAASTVESHFNRLGASDNSVININAETQVSSALDVVESTLNVNGDLTVGTTSGLRAISGRVNLIASELTGSLRLSDRASDFSPAGITSTFARDADSVLTLFDLEIQGATSLDLTAGDSVSRFISLSDQAELNVAEALTLNSVSIDDGAVFNLFQEDGQADGLLVDSLSLDGGTLNIFFDDVELDGLDFGLAIQGDARDRLQGFLDDGSIVFSGGSQPIDIIYNPDAFGNTTFLGSVSTVSVPEPSSVLLFFGGIVGLLARRKRQN